MTHALARVHEVLGRVEVAPLLPATREVLRFTAKTGTIHYSTMIEGNRLSMREAEAAAGGLLDSDALTREERELVNYAEALRFIDEKIAADPGAQPDKALLLELHRITTAGLERDEVGPLGESFTGEHVGAFRPGDVAIRDETTGDVVFVGPDPAHVEPLIDGMFEWLAERWDAEIDWPAPVLAALVHYKITEIHPFADGNGRIARLLAYWTMSALGYMPNRMFNLDAYYGKNKPAYLAALRSVKANTNSLNEWVEYFLTGVALECEHVGATIERLLEVSGAPEGKTQLTLGQQRALLWLLSDGRQLFTAQEYERASRVSPSTARKEIRALRSRAIIVDVDGHRETYALAATQSSRDVPSARSTRARVWDEATIESTLREMTAESGRFPSQREFSDRGYMGLYQAIHRGAGTAAWARRLGIAPPRRGRPRKAT